MTGHLLVPARDEVPATLSRRILTGLLRDELGFDGLVVTDALEMRAISADPGVEEGAVLALAAGADLLCLGHDLHEEAVDAVLRAIIGRGSVGPAPAGAPRGGSGPRRHCGAVGFASELGGSARPRGRSRSRAACATYSRQAEPRRSSAGDRAGRARECRGGTSRTTAWPISGRGRCAYG